MVAARKPLACTKAVQHQVRKQTGIQEGIGPCQPFVAPWFSVSAAALDLWFAQQRWSWGIQTAVAGLWKCSGVAVPNPLCLFLGWYCIVMAAFCPLSDPCSWGSLWTADFPKLRRHRGGLIPGFVLFPKLLPKYLNFFTIAITLRMLLFLWSLYSEVELPCLCSKYCFIYLLGFTEAQFGFIPLF